jgi:hypothetical protein
MPRGHIWSFCSAKWMHLIFTALSGCIMCVFCIEQAHSRLFAALSGCLLFFMRSGCIGDFLIGDLILFGAEWAHSFSSGWGVHLGSSGHTWQTLCFVSTFGTFCVNWAHLFYFTGEYGSAIIPQWHAKWVCWNLWVFMLQAIEDTLGYALFWLWEGVV